MELYVLHFSKPCCYFTTWVTPITRSLELRGLSDRLSVDGLQRTVAAYNFTRLSATTVPNLLTRFTCRP